MPNAQLSKEPLTPHPAPSALNSQMPAQVTSNQGSNQGGTASNTSSAAIPNQAHTDNCCNKPGGCTHCSKDGSLMKKEALSFITLFLIGVVAILGVLLFNQKQTGARSVSEQTGSVTESAIKTYEKPALKAIREVLELPAARLTSAVSVEEALQDRRSRRFFSDQPVTQQELAQILWSAQGITDELGHRAAPSARSAYPYSVYVVIRNVEGIEAGLYVYNPEDHSLGNLGLVNAGERLIEAGVQDNSQNSPVVLALVAAPALMQEKAPDTDPLPNVYLEAGHIGQNIYLQVESLKMATVVTGGFNKEAVAQALELDPINEVVVYLIPFGNVGEEPARETD